MWRISGLFRDVARWQRTGGADAARFLQGQLTNDTRLLADGRTHLDELAVDAAALQAQVEAQAKAKPDTEVQLRADRSVPYGRVAEVIGWVQEAGLTRIGFITEAPTGP